MKNFTAKLTALTLAVLALTLAAVLCGLVAADAAPAVALVAFLLGSGSLR